VLESFTVLTDSQPPLVSNLKPAHSCGFGKEPHITSQKYLECCWQEPLWELSCRSLDGSRGLKPLHIPISGTSQIFHYTGLGIAPLGGQLGLAECTAGGACCISENREHYPWEYTCCWPHGDPQQRQNSRHVPTQFPPPLPSVPGQAPATDLAGRKHCRPHCCPANRDILRDPWATP
jgi:hypothetical protein